MMLHTGTTVIRLAFSSLVGVAGDLIAHHHLLHQPLVAGSRVVVPNAHGCQ